MSREPTDDDRATLKRIIEARTLAWASSGKPDLDHAWCGSCGRPLRECLDLSGCPLVEGVLKLGAKHRGSSRGVDSVIVWDSLNATVSDRSDKTSVPRNRHERRAEVAKERSRRPHRRRRG